MDDFDYLLSWGETLQDFLAYSARADSFYKVLDHLEIHVGFQESQANFFQGLRDVLLGQFPVPPEFLKDGAQLLCQRIKHGFLGPK
jgi:hypothetical protein